MFNKDTSRFVIFREFAKIARRGGTLRNLSPSLR